MDPTHEEQMNKVAFSPDGECLATGSGDKTARVWDWAGGEEVARTIHDDVVNDVAFSRLDGKYLATASDDGTARVQRWQSEDLIDEACTLPTRNLTKEGWQKYVGDEPYHQTCPNPPEPEG